MEFIYTGELILNSQTDLDTFQQLVYQFQIGLDEKYAIFIDEFIIENDKKSPSPIPVESQVIKNQ